MRIFAVIWYVGNYRSLTPGLEYGSAKFADPNRVNEKLEDTDETKNKILSENNAVSIIKLPRGVARSCGAFFRV